MALFPFQANGFASGPDGFGYYTFDQDHGCAYQFVDISGSGTMVISGNDAQADRSLGITGFSLYGAAISQLAVNTNGFLSTDTGGLPWDRTNDCPLPKPPSTGTGSRLYALHDDLTTTVYHQHFSICPRSDDFQSGAVECDIFQWNGSYNGTGSVVIQVILYETINEIVYQYHTATETGDSSTTGMQNPAALDGLRYACNTQNSIVSGTTAVCVFPSGALSACSGPDATIDAFRFTPYANYSCLDSSSISIGGNGVVVEPNAVVNMRAPATIISSPFKVRAGGIFTVGGVAGSCSSGTDSDSDRLDDCVETNLGVFVNSNDTGTDPNDADTDGDGINDGDEVLGTLAGLNLPGMGAHPLRKNILLEYDWFDDNLDPGICGAHSHQPTAAMMEMTKQGFAAAPVTNPDGTKGIVVIQDYGQGGPFSGGNLISDSDGVLVGGVGNAEFAAHRAANFASNRQGYYHYVILPHRYNTNSSSSGQAELAGKNMIVSLYCFGSVTNIAHTIMHELGHNLNLRHGGFEDTNWKPNYNSVMNYKYQFPGIDGNCTPPGDQPLSYSTGVRIPLNELNLDENAGTCGFPSWDWNTNNVIEAGVTADINCDGDDVCDSFFNTLLDYDDWNNLLFAGPSGAPGRSPLSVQQEVISCDNVPREVLAE